MEESVSVRYVFMMMLAIADASGEVIGTDVAISRRLNIPLQEFRNCVEILGKPDPDSNSGKQDGKRVIPSEGERGYFLVNYTVYRGIRDEEERKAYMRDYMRKRRAGVADEDVAPVNSVNFGKPPLAQTETETSHTHPATGSNPDIETFVTYMKEHAGLSDEYARYRWGLLDSAGWVNGSGMPIRRWRSLSGAMQKYFREEGHKKRFSGPNGKAEQPHRPNYETDEMKRMRELREAGHIQ